MLKLLLLYSLPYFFVSTVTCAPMTDENGMNYLRNFGYTNNKTIKQMTDTEMKESIEAFQRNTQTPVTGILDEETKRMMEVPRCKMPDTKTFEYTGRWNKSRISYRFLNYPNHYYSDSTIRELILKAMKLWLHKIDLVAEEINENEIEPDIYIEFVDDSVLLSNEGVVLAYAAAPDDGDMYYLKNIGDYEVNLYQVAAHEFGHSLGLDHLNDVNSVMYPYFVNKDNFELNSTDIEYVQVLYGKNYSPCEDGNIDAAFHIGQTTYILRGFQVWKYSLGTLQPKYPKLFSEEFPGLSTFVNATFFYANHIYFIQGRQVLKFNGINTERFASLENDYQASVTIGERLYVFKGSQYWRYDIDANGMSMVRKDYPRNISRLWKGVPGDIDAVYYDFDAHFFKGTRYYRFDTNALIYNAVETSISEWEGCKNN